MTRLVALIALLFVPTFALPDEKNVSADDKGNSLIPAGWDAALAGDQVLRRLVKVTAPQVKGAHDAELAIVGRTAYIVAEVDDKAAGESAGRPHIYSTLSVVNLDSLKVEDIRVIARGEQVFANTTLPEGAIFVPRIYPVNAATLRCYFASERPGQRQSQMWYRDFDVRSRTFAPTIHMVKLKTAAGTYDMQPRYFHTDAAAAGFAKPAKDFGLYLFDSFKVFDGKTYIALNNFPGKQNALALVHDDFATFEILGHYNEPQSENLSESAVNRLPDGTWMAICRNDSGNYHFTTSNDGRKWTTARQLTLVPNGANSKPTFDRFGEIYYLGWQEATRVHGVYRSVFNVDISRDGVHWQRKYRFETTNSFQYPTFREHDGQVWLTVTQGDHAPSRKERIMFGMLEEVGEFASQDGLTREPILAPRQPPMIVEPAVLQPGVKLFINRSYALREMPAVVKGRTFLRTSIERTDLTVTRPGTLYALTPTLRPGAASQEKSLQTAGFAKVDVPEVQLFPGEINRVSLYRKDVAAGERLQFGKFVLFVMGKGVELEAIRPAARDATNHPAKQKADCEP